MTCSVRIRVRIESRSGSETVAVSIWDLRCRWENANLSSRGCSPWLAAAWSPLRVDLVRCVPAPLHSSQSQCAARPRPGCLVASTRSAARRRPARRAPMPGILVSWTFPRLVSQSAALCLPPP
jgi:hypothetical protein